MGKLISIIIPVYQTEKYVSQCIDSVIRQTIGFKERIELILVNNGTKDGAGKICRDYVRSYDNIIYIELKENKGPSGARNVGLKRATGKYINFLDSDDLWEPDAIEKLYQYISNHTYEIDMVAGRLRHFDGRDEWHILDWKFKGQHEKIVDITSNPDYIQLHVGSILFKSDIAKSVCFDEDVRHSEDSKYLNKILLKKGRYGLLSEAVYLYRTRTENDSALQNAHKSRMWYINTVERVYQAYIDCSIKKYGEVPRYIQFLNMHEMQWRLAIPPEIGDVDLNIYREAIRKILLSIDDDIIWKSRFLWEERKIYAICLKRGIENNANAVRNFAINFFPVTYGLRIQSIQVFNQRLHIKGMVRFPYEQSGDFKVDIGDCSKDIMLRYTGEGDVYSLGKCIAKAGVFFVSVPFVSGERIFFRLVDENQYFMKVRKFGNTKIDSEQIVVSEDYIECR